MQVSLMRGKGEKNYKAHPISCRRENLMNFYHKALSDADMAVGKKNKAYSDMRRATAQRPVVRKDSQPEGDTNGVLYARETC